MNTKKLAATLVAVATVAGVGVYISSRSSSSDEAGQLALAEKHGIVNPEQSAAAMKTQPMPQLSDARFEPPPTIATGTYTDPKHRKPVETKDNSSAR